MVRVRFKRVRGLCLGFELEKGLGLVFRAGKRVRVIARFKRLKELGLSPRAGKRIRIMVLQAQNELRRNRPNLFLFARRD